jgi:hypothetical protein
MQKNTMIGLRAVGNWIQRILDARLPAGVTYGLRKS